jgi:hypothetical protein
MKLHKIFLVAFIIYLLNSLFALRLNTKFSIYQTSFILVAWFLILTFIFF